MKLHPIETGNLKLDGGAMFGVVPKSIWQKHYPADENNLCNWAMRCLLVETKDRKILIDNGVGDKQDTKFFGHYYLNGNDSMEASFKKINISYDEVTDVILTHLHFDHCGGSIKYNEDKTKTELVFPNANYWISEEQWNLAIKPNNREKASFLKENILPIQEHGKLKLIKKDCELYPDISIRLYHGHTTGQVIPFINYKGKTVIFMADLLPAVAHIPIPWVISYDTRPLITLKEKESLMKEAADKGYIFFFEHDLYNECCTLKHTEKGVRADKTFKLSEI